jgi:hypothetical protein
LKGYRHPVQLLSVALYRMNRPATQLGSVLKQYPAAARGKRDPDWDQKSREPEVNPAYPDPVHEW